MVQGYLLSEENANWVDANRKKSVGPATSGPSLPFQFYQQTRIPFKNISGETMPAFGIGLIMGSVLVNGSYVLTIDKPNDTNGYFGNFLINLEFDVPNGHLGTATLADIVEVKLGSYTAPYNQIWGINGWELAPLPTGKGYTNVCIIEDADATKGTVACKISPINQIFIKAPSGGIPGRVGTFFGNTLCDYYVYNTSTGGITDSGHNVRIYNWGVEAACANGDRYGVASRLNDRWVVISEDCADEGSVIVPAGININFPSYQDETDVEISGSIIIQGGQTEYSGNVIPAPVIGGFLKRSGGDDIFRPDGTSEYYFPP